MHLTPAGAEDSSALRALWARLYDDPAEYIDLFFRHRFRPEETLVLREGGDMAGVMYLLPCTLRDGRECEYAYAGGIAPGYRGKGYFRALVSALTARSRETGRALCCVPGEGLWELYRSLGFGTAYFRRELPMSPGDGAGVRLSPLSPEAHGAMRQCFAGADTVLWGTAALDYARREAEADRGFAVTVTAGGRDYFALGGLRGDALTVQETSLPPRLLSPAAGALTARYGGDRVVWHLPPESGIGALRPAGLLLGGEKSADGWLGLTMVV